MLSIGQRYHFLLTRGIIIGTYEGCEDDFYVLSHVTFPKTSKQIDSMRVNIDHIITFNEWSSDEDRPNVQD